MRCQHRSGEERTVDCFFEPSIAIPFLKFLQIDFFVKFFVQMVRLLNEIHPDMLHPGSLMCVDNMYIAILGLNDRGIAELSWTILKAEVVFPCSSFIMRNSQGKAECVVPM